MSIIARFDLSVLINNFNDRVLKNIAHLCGRSKSKMWGPEGWKKVVVCVVSDGRSKVNKRTLQVLSLVRPFFPVSFHIDLYIHCRWVVIKRVSPRTLLVAKMLQRISLSMF